jgi:hypothetical protein
MSGDGVKEWTVIVKSGAEKIIKTISDQAAPMPPCRTQKC